jgi:hypothetical protein
MVLGLDAVNDRIRVCNAFDALSRYPSKLTSLAGCRSDQRIIDRRCDGLGENSLIVPILSAFIRQIRLISGLSAFSSTGSYAVMTLTDATAFDAEYLFVIHPLSSDGGRNLAR